MENPRNRHRQFVIWPALAVIVAAGCSSTRQEHAEIVVARVDGVPITATQLQAEMQRQGMTPASTLEDQHYRGLALDTLITELLVRREAERRDLTRDFGVQRLLRQTVLLLAFRLYAEEVITPQIMPTAEDIEGYWREHPEQFTVQKTIVDPQQIVLMADLKDQAYREIPQEYAGWTAAAIIEDLYRRLLAGEDFDTLALYYSQDIYTRLRGGRMGWRYYDSTQATPWTDSVFSFPAGTLRPPFFSEKAWYIIRINGRHDPGEVLIPDDSTRGEVGRVIARRRIQEWVKKFTDSLLVAGRAVVFDSTLSIPAGEVPAGLPMAVVNGTDTVYGGEFAEHAVLYRTADGSRVLQLEDRRRVLNELLKQHAFWSTMDELGYLDRPDVARTRTEFLFDAAAQQVRAGAIDRTFVPSEEEIAAFYERHLAEFSGENPVHVQHIVVENLDTARAIRQLLAEGADFADLARRCYRGDPELRDVTFDLGFISAQDMPEGFFAAALALNPGEISEPVRTEWGYHLIRVVEKRPGQSLAEMRDTIAARLRQSHEVGTFRRWRENLIAGHQVVVDGQALASVPILPAAPADTATDTLSARRP